MFNNISLFYYGSVSMYIPLVRHEIYLYENNTLMMAAAANPPVDVANAGGGNLIDSVWGNKGRNNGR